MHPQLSPELGPRRAEWPPPLLGDQLVIVGRLVIARLAIRTYLSRLLDTLIGTIHALNAHLDFEFVHLRFKPSRASI